MFILIKNNGNVDGDIALDLIGTYNTYEDAHKAMKEDLENHVANFEWEEGDRKLREMDAFAVDGDWWDHEYYAIWVIFDSDNPMAWTSY